jgi:hypothetical protein
MLSAGLLIIVGLIVWLSGQNRRLKVLENRLLALRDRIQHLEELSTPGVPENAGVGQEPVPQEIALTASVGQSDEADTDISSTRDEVEGAAADVSP